MIKCIGHGSFGEVWLARTIMGSHRAVKIVYRHTFDHPRPYEREFEGIRRFEPVSRRHESQLAVLHVGRNDEAGYFYYVMELADDASVAGGDWVRVGTTLDPECYLPRTLKHELEQRGRLPVEECLRIALSLTTALEHLHGHGLIHRDIKPSNIIFVEGVPKLADIGLIATLDATMSVSGTPGYIAPEGSGTPRGDIYSLAKVLYEMSMGRDRGEFPKLPPDFVTLPNRHLLLELNAVLVKAGHGDPAHRYRTAAEMHADVALIRSGRSVKRLHRLERHLAVARRIAAGVLAAAVVIAGGWWQSWREHRQANQHLARLHAREATQRLMKDGHFAALPWLVGALQLEQGNPRSKSLHRARLAAVLQECPRPVGIYSAPDGIVLGADLSADGRRLATAHEDDRVRLWDVATGRLLETIPHGFPVHHCRFVTAPDLLLTCTFNQQAHVWPLQVGPAESRTLPHYVLTRAEPRYESTFNRRTKPLQVILTKTDFSPAMFEELNGPAARLEGLTLRVTYTADATSVRVRQEVWEQTSPGTVLMDQEFLDTPGSDVLPAGYETGITAPLRGRVGLILFGGIAQEDHGQDGQVVWDNLRLNTFPTGEPAPPAWRVLDDFNGDELKQWLVTGNPPMTEIRTEHGRLVFRAKNYTSSDRGPAVVYATPLEIKTGHTLQLEVDVVSVTGCFSHVSLLVCRPTYQHFPGSWDPVLSADDELLALASEDGTIRILDLKRTRNGTLPQQESQPRLELRHRAQVCSARFSADGRYLTTVTDSIGEVFVWDLNNGTTVPLALTSATRFNEADFSPDGRWLALAGADGLRFVRVTDWQEVAAPSDARPLSTLAFSPVGRRLAAIREDGSVGLWDLSDLERPPMNIELEEAAQRILFSPDGQYLACQVVEGQTRLCKVTTGRMVGPPLPGALGRFTTEGSRLLLVGPGGGAWLWDLTRTMSEEIRLRPVASPETSAGSPDGTLSVSIGGKRASIEVSGFHSGVLDHSRPLRRALFSADQRYVLTETSDLRCWIWDPLSGTLMAPARPVRYDVGASQYAEVSLPAEHRDLQILSRLATLLGGQRFDKKGVLEPVSPEVRERLFRELAEAYPAEFAVDRDVRIRWHAAQARQCEHEREWEAAVFHWEHLLKPEFGELLPGSPLAPPPGGDSGGRSVGDDESPSSRLTYARQAAEQERAAVHAGRSRMSVIAPRPERATAAMLDLSPYYTQSLDEDVAPARRENSFRRMPGGVQTLSGLGFDVRGLIHLDRTKSVTIPLNRPCRRIHFLHAANRDAFLAVTGVYVVTYATGESARAELFTPIDLPLYRTCAFHQGAEPAKRSSSPELRHARAWAGTNPEVEARDETLFLTRTTWTLPEAYRDPVVANLELRAPSPFGAPLIFAITVE
jgi:WD40 repeat protein